jgi:hypothetical protein
MKKVSLFSKVILFLNSYTPLGIMYLIGDYSDLKYPFFTHPIFSAILSFCIVVLWIILFLFIRHFKKAEDRQNVKTINVRNLDNEILSYIFTYIIPFLSFPADKTIPMSLILLFVIGILYIKSDMIGINPILSICGYHLIKVEFTNDTWETSKESIVISKIDYFTIKCSKKIKITKIHNEIYLLQEVIE